MQKYAEQIQLLDRAGAGGGALPSPACQHGALAKTSCRKSMSALGHETQPTRSAPAITILAKSAPILSGSQTLTEERLAPWTNCKH